MEARKAPILLMVKSPSLLIEKSEGLPGRNLSQIQRRLRLFPSVALVSASARLVSYPPVGLPRFQIADTQPRQIFLIALIYLLDGEICVIHLILP